MISTIIPTYNRAHLITAALDSVKSQTYRPIEIVVVDDGSTDDTPATVDQWASNNSDDQLSLKLIVQNNRGGNAARNAGIEASSAPVVAFLDSDDLWAEDKLRKQYQRLQQQPDLGAVYCGLAEIAADESSSNAPAPREYPEGRLYPHILVRDATAPTSCYLIPRAVLDAVGLFDESLQARQDWDLWIRIARRYPIGAVQESLVYYRDHEGPRTTSEPMREVHAYQQIRRKYASLLRQQSWAFRRRALGAYHARVGRVTYHRDVSVTRALWHDLLAIYYSPMDPNHYAALLGIFLPTAVRTHIRKRWNRWLGHTVFAIRSH